MIKINDECVERNCSIWLLISINAVHVLKSRSISLIFRLFLLFILITLLRSTRIFWWAMACCIGCFCIYTKNLPSKTYGALRNSLKIYEPFWRNNRAKRTSDCKENHFFYSLLFTKSARVRCKECRLCLNIKANLQTGPTTFIRDNCCLRFSLKWP